MRWTTLLFWVIIAPFFAGILIMAAILTPALQVDLGRWIVICAAVGAVLAIPASFFAVKSVWGRAST
jgi:hypothetical protein